MKIQYLIIILFIFLSLNSCDRKFHCIESASLKGDTIEAAVGETAVVKLKDISGYELNYFTDADNDYFPGNNALLFPIDSTFKSTYVERTYHNQDCSDLIYTDIVRIKDSCNCNPVANTLQFSNASAFNLNFDYAHYYLSNNYLDCESSNGYLLIYFNGDNIHEGVYTVADDVFHFFTCTVEYTSGSYFFAKSGFVYIHIVDGKVHAQFCDLKFQIGSGIKNASGSMNES